VSHGCPSANSVEQLGRRYLECAGENDDRRESRVTPGPLEQSDLCAVEAASIAKRLLRQPFASALAHVNGADRLEKRGLNTSVPRQQVGGVILQCIQDPDRRGDFSENRLEVLRLQLVEKSTVVRSESPFASSRRASL
jgi:hypothetical protein